MVTILLIALTLCVDSFTVSAAATFGKSMPLRKGLTMAYIFALCQGVTPLLGALLGVGFQSVMSSIDHWVAFGLLFVVGCKMIIDAWHGSKNNNTLDTNKTGVMIVLGIATSIDAFVVGIGMGLEQSWQYILLFIATVAITTFLLSLLGCTLGSRRIVIPEKTAGIIAGLVLIILGSHTLLEHITKGM